MMKDLRAYKGNSSEELCPRFILRTPVGKIGSPNIPIQRSSDDSHGLRAIDCFVEKTSDLPELKTKFKLILENSSNDFISC